MLKVKIIVSSGKDENLVKSLEKGLSNDLKDITNPLKFTKRYQLIGLKGLGTDKGINSLGAFVFDTDCDITEPNGIGLAAKAAAGIKPIPIPEPEKGKENITTSGKTLQQSEVTAIWVSLLVIFLVIILVTVLIAAFVHRRRAM